MHDIKYAWYNTTKGYKIVGGTANQFLKADGSVDSESYWSSTNLQHPMTKDTNEEVWSTKTFSNGIPFIFKMAGSKSWLWHKPSFNSLIFAPSSSVFGTDWDWSKQIELKDNGNIKGNGFEVVGKDDNYLVKAGGGTELADNFRDKLITIDNDTTTVPDRTEQTTNVIISGVWGSEVTLGMPNVNAGHTVNLVRIDEPTSGYYTDIICDSTSVTNMFRQRMTLISNGTNWIDITDWKDIAILY